MPTDTMIKQAMKAGKSQDIIIDAPLVEIKSRYEPIPDPWEHPKHKRVVTQGKGI